MGIIGTDEKERTYLAEQIRSAAAEMRGYALISIHCAGSGHSGGTLSAMDALAALYLRVLKHKPGEPDWAGRDRLFFSAGHKAPAWYAPLGW
jgi:transketolase